MKHTVAVLVENSFGVLARVAGLFSARGFNIDSLAVGETHDPQISRMTIVAHGNDRVLEQIMKQLAKLIDVICVEDLKPEDMMERELVLVKVQANAATRNDIMQIVNTFRAKIVDVSQDTLTIEVTGGESKVDAMLELLQPFKLLEVVRTGTVAISRNSVLSVPAAEIVEPKRSAAAATQAAAPKKTKSKTKEISK
ncbi:MAG: acetolactate synthase small subunit [Candidatus Omnitrophica bacterium]|nr:acetolactate synthase small subunit [Candidatus Omnitrophota bacterium]